MKLSFDERGPFLLLGLDQVSDVGRWLIDRGVPFVEDEGASTSCAGPVLAVLRFDRQLDPDALQSTLDSWPGEAMDAGKAPDRHQERLR